MKKEMKRERKRERKTKRKTERKTERKEERFEHNAGRERLRASVVSMARAILLNDKFEAVRDNSQEACRCNVLTTGCLSMFCIKGYSPE